MAHYVEDYYKTQGLAFISTDPSGNGSCCSRHRRKNVSTYLLESKMLKAHKLHDNWTVCNCLQKQMKLFKQLNTPLEVALSLHT